MVKKYRVTVAGERYDVEVEEVGAETAPAVRSAEPAPRVRPIENVPTPHSGNQLDGDGRVNSPLPGKVLAVKVAPGSQVKRGDLLLTIEAMKMENELFAGESGTVRRVHVSAGQNVETGDLLVELTPGG